MLPWISYDHTTRAMRLSSNVNHSVYCENIYHVLNVKTIVDSTVCI